MAGDDRFFVRGVAYQPGGAADAQDPLLDTEALSADIEMFKELGINLIRIYTVDNSGNHDEAMKETLHQSYNAEYLQHLFSTIDAFAGYSEYPTSNGFRRNKLTE